MSHSKNSSWPARKRLRPNQLHEVYQRLRRAHGHQRWWPGDTPFEIIVGAILTQNTAWTNVEKAIDNLKKEKLLTPLALRRVTRKKLASCIRPSGYFNIKADRLKHFIEFLYREYGGSLTLMFRTPLKPLRQKLLAVKGIGPETADSILLYAGNKKSFVIDAYTKRIFSRHGLHPERADYHEWQEVFSRALPAKTGLYNDFHAQIVYTGKYYCQKKANCEGCPLREYL